MKARLLCQDPEHQIDQLVDIVSLEPLKIDLTIRIHDSLHSIVDRIIYDAFSDTFFEIVFESFDLAPAGYYKLDDVDDALKKHGIKRIKEYCAAYPYEITLFSCDDDALPSPTVIIDLCDVLLRVFETRSGDLQNSFDVGGIVIDSMEKFIEMAKWHCEMVDSKGLRVSDDRKQIPLMWFGIDGDPPEKGWILSPHFYNDLDDWREFWFYDCDEGEERRVEDWSAVSLAIGMEAGMYLPFVDISTCPAAVTDEMMPEEVENRIVEYYNSIIKE